MFVGYSICPWVGLEDGGDFWLLINRIKGTKSVEGRNCIIVNPLTRELTEEEFLKSQSLIYTVVQACSQLTQ